MLTPKALSARLKVAPQTGTALLRELRAAGLVREVTGEFSRVRYLTTVPEGVTPSNGRWIHPSGTVGRKLVTFAYEGVSNEGVSKWNDGWF